MYLLNDEQLFVTSLADADQCLMSSLAVSHGLEFAAAFRIEYAEQVTKAMWMSAQSRFDLAKCNTIPKFMAKQ